MKKIFFIDNLFTPLKNEKKLFFIYYLLFCASQMRLMTLFNQSILCQNVQGHMTD